MSFEEHFIHMGFCIVDWVSKLQNAAFSRHQVSTGRGGIGARLKLGSGLEYLVPIHTRFWFGQLL